MKLRKITKPIVEEALANPDKVVMGKMIRRIALKRHKNKLIKVTFEQAEG